MKKKIDYDLGADEKQILKQQKVTQKNAGGLCPRRDRRHLASFSAACERTECTGRISKHPLIGYGFAKELIAQGYYSLDGLMRKTAVELFDAFEKHCGCWAAPCVEDAYRLLVHYIKHKNDSKRWRNFSAERKAYRAQYGFPADRPKTAWYETGAFPEMQAYKEV